MNNKLKLSLEDESTKDELETEQQEDEEQEKVINSGDFEDEDDAEDSAETIVSDMEDPDYATNEKYNELRDIILDTEYRLFLINDDMAIIGTIDANNDSEYNFLNKQGDEFVLVKAPMKLVDLMLFPTLYSKDTETPHEEIVKYLMSLNLKDEDTPEELVDIENEESEKEESEDESIEKK